MASSGDVHIDEQGWTHSSCLHRDGFPSLLWDSLQYFGQTMPPEYVGREYLEHGVHCCDVHLMIPANEARPDWEPWSVRVQGMELSDTCEIAALQALAEFCEKHKYEIEGTPMALFPIRDQSDPTWRRRVLMLSDPHQTLVHLSTTKFNIIEHLMSEQQRSLHELREAAQERENQHAQLKQRHAQLNQQLNQNKQRIELLRKEIELLRERVAKKREEKELYCLQGELQKAGTAGSSYSGNRLKGGLLPSPQ